MKHTISLLVFALCTAFASAQTLMPSRQVSVSTNDWDYLAPTLPTAQSTFDWLDQELLSTFVSMSNLTASVDALSAEVDALAPDVANLVSNAVTSVTFLPADEFAADIADNELGLTFPSNLVRGIEVTATPGTTVTYNPTNGITSIDLSSSFASGYASMRYHDPTYSTNTYTLPDSLSASVGVAVGSRSASSTNVLYFEPTNHNLRAASAGTYFVHAGIGYQGLSNTFSTVYLFHIRADLLSAVTWPLVESRTADEFAYGSVSIVVPNVQVGDYFRLRFLRGPNTFNLGYATLEAFRLYEE